MKKLLSLVLCFAMLLSSMTAFAGRTNQRGFNDLGRDHWAYKSVMQMVNKGILEGFEDGSFRPNDPVTRAQFAKILVASMGLSLSQSGAQTFADVPSSDWSYPYVQAAQNYLTGYRQNGQLYFRGDNVAVREDMAVAVVIAKGMDNQSADLSVLDSFSDSDSISPSLKNYIAIAVKNHIMDGYGDGFFGPQNTLTRAEAAELMYKSGILNDNGDKVVVGNKDNTPTVKTFNDGNITFQYPAEFSMRDVTSNRASSGNPDYVVGFPYNIAMANGITIDVGYFNWGAGSTTLESTYKYWNDLYSRLNPPTNNVTKVGETVVDQFVQDSYNPGRVMQAHIYGRGIEKTIPNVQIAADKTPSQLTQAERDYFIKVRDMIAKSLKVVNSTQPANTLAPTVVSTVPANGTVDAVLGEEIVINYNKEWKHFVTGGPDQIEFVDNSNGSRVFRGISINDGKLELASNPFKTIKIKFSAKDIKPSTNYTVIIPDGIMFDAAGNFNDKYMFSFLTASNNTPFKVTSTTPADGAANVDVSAPILVTYSKKIGSVNTSSFFLSVMSDNGTVVETRTEYNGNVLKITGNFKPGTKYTVYLVKGLVKDEQGNATDGYNFSFTTKAADTTTPTVISTTPANNATNINSTLPWIPINFSEKVTNVDTTKISFTDNAGNAMKFTIDKDRENGFTIQPNPIMKPNTKYTITLKAGVVTDAAGNLSQAYSFSFTTAGDNTPFQVISSSIGGATDVTLDAEISFEFNRTPNSFVNTGITMIDANGHALPSTILLTDKKVTIVPKEVLKPGMKYLVNVPVGTATDYNGKQSLAYSFSFTTKAAAPIPPKVVSTSPTNGANSISISPTIKVQFSKPITTLFKGNVTIKDPFGKDVSRGYSVNADNIEMHPILLPNTKYTVNLENGVVADYSGIASESYSFSFTTTSYKETTPPKIISTTPSNGAVDVASPNSFTLYFSERVDIADNISGITVKDSSGKLVTMGSSSLNETWYEQTVQLQPGTRYTVTVPQGAFKDDAGNLNVAYTFSFTTKSASTTQTYNDGKITFEYPLDYTLRPDNMGGAYSGGKYGVSLMTSYDQRIGYTTLTSTSLNDVYNAALSEYGSAVGKSVTVNNNAIVIFTNNPNWYYYDIYGRGIGATAPHVQLMLTSVEMSNDQKAALDQAKNKILSTFRVISNEQPVNNGAVAVQMDKVFNDGKIKFSYPAALVLSKTNQTTVSGYENYIGTVGDCTVQVQYIKWDSSPTNISAIGNYLYSFYSSQQSQLFQGGWVSNVYLASSLDNSKPFQDLMYGRGMGNVVPLITITTSKPSGQYLAGDTELDNYLKLRDKIANSFSVISTVPAKDI